MFMLFLFSFLQDEKQRIEDLGGCITFMGCWRVNGTYAVSRAIGKTSSTNQNTVHRIVPSYKTLRKSFCYGCDYVVKNVPCC